MLYLANEAKVLLHNCESESILLSLSSSRHDRQSPNVVGTSETMEYNPDRPPSLDKIKSERGGSSRKPTDLPSQQHASGATSGPSKTHQPGEGVRFRKYQAEIWSEKFKELCIFRQIHGHSSVPHRHSENLALAKWVKRQRYQYKLRMEKKRSTLTEERIRMLDGVKFVWSSHDAIWEERFQQLLEYKKIYGNCIVPSVFDKNPSLGIWTKRQRRQYKNYQNGKSSSMTKSRIDRLENIGFVWTCHNTSKSDGDRADDRLGRSSAAAAKNTPLKTTGIGTPTSKNVLHSSVVPMDRGSGVAGTTIAPTASKSLLSDNKKIDSSLKDITSPLVTADSPVAMLDDLHLSCDDLSCGCDLSINSDLFMDHEQIISTNRSTPNTTNKTELNTGR